VVPRLAEAGMTAPVMRERDGSWADDGFRSAGKRHRPQRALRPAVDPNVALAEAPASAFQNRGRQTPSSSSVRCARGSRYSSAPGSVSVPK
jgi:hypothetical protein